MAGKHRADGGEGYSVHGRGNRGTDDGERNPGRDDERTREQYNQALAEQHARDHQARHGNSER